MTYNSTIQRLIVKNKVYSLLIFYLCPVNTEITTRNLFYLKVFSSQCTLSNLPYL